MKRIYLAVKKMLGFRMTYGELAEIAGAGPCKRCVGMAVVGAQVNPPDIKVNPHPDTGSGGQPGQH